MGLLDTIGDVLTWDPLGGSPATDAGAKLADIGGKDTKVHVSDVLARNGWGSKTSNLNGRARAVVYRESGGNPKAHNPSGATGWFQMMTPLHCGHYGIPKETSACVKWLEDPDNNAHAAHLLFLANGWAPWAASGGVPLPTNWDPVVTTEKRDLLDTAGDAANVGVDAINVLGDVAGALLNPSTYLRLGKGLLGGTLIILGVGGIVFIVGQKVSGGNLAKAIK